MAATMSFHNVSFQVFFPERSKVAEGARERLFFAAFEFGVIVQRRIMSVTFEAFEALKRFVSTCKKFSHYRTTLGAIIGWEMLEN